MSDDASTQDAPPVLLRTARRTYAAAIRAELNTAGFGDLPALSGQYAIRAVRRGNPPLATIARELAITRQAASKLIDLLVARGFVERTEDPADRRRIVLELTDRGRDAAEVIDAGTRHVDEQLRTRLSPAELAGYRATLSVLVELYPHYLELQERSRSLQSAVLNET